MIPSKTEQKRWLWRRRFTDFPGDATLCLHALGIEEIMRPGLVNRPGGTGDWLLMCFATGTAVAARDGVATLSADAAILWSPDAGHYYGCEAHRWRHSWVHFDGTAAAVLAAEAGIESGVLYPVCHSNIVRHLRHFTQELEWGGPADAGILRRILANLFAEFRRGGEHPATMTPAAVRRGADWIEQAWRTGCDLTGAARAAGLSVSHFSAEFRRFMGCSPMGYMQKLRLQEAEYLLRDRGLAIGEVAERLGFRDVYYFSRLFRRKTGMTPTAYRAQL